MRTPTAVLLATIFIGCLVWIVTLGQTSLQDPQVEDWPTDGQTLAPFGGNTPRPIVVQATEPEDQVRELVAGLARRGDPKNYARVVAIFNLAGFNITENGKIVLAADPSRDQGLAITTFEIYVAYAAHELGWEKSLEEMATGAMQVVDLDMTEYHFVAQLKQGILNGYAEQNAGAKFWAAAISELGSISSAPWGKSNLGNLTDIRLGQIQMTLLFTRLAAEIASSAAATTSQGDQSTHNIASSISSESTTSGEYAALSKHHSGCAAEGAQEVILEGTKIILPRFWVELYHTMEREGFGPAPSKRFLGLANVFLAFVKMGIYAQYFDVKFEFARGGPPLNRTNLASEHAEQATVRAVAQLRDVDERAWINCATVAAGALGLEFSVPHSGPLSNVPVRWELIEGGFTAEGGVLVDRGLVELGLTDTSTKTNEEGRTEVDVIGLPQRYNIPNTSPRVTKRAGLRIGVAMKPADMFHDFKDIVGTFNASEWNPYVAAAGSIPEVLYRSKVFLNRDWYFDVRDWEFQIGGTIKINLSFKYNHATTVDNTTRVWMAEGNMEQNIAIDRVYTSDENAESTRLLLEGVPSKKSRFRVLETEESHETSLCYEDPLKGWKTGTAHQRDSIAADTTNFEFEPHNNYALEIRGSKYQPRYHLRVPSWYSLYAVGVRNQINEDTCPNGETKRHSSTEHYVTRIRIGNENDQEVELEGAVRSDGVFRGEFKGSGYIDESFFTKGSRQVGVNIPADVSIKLNLSPAN